MDTLETLQSSLFDLDQDSDRLMVRDSFAQQNNNSGNFKDSMLHELEAIDSFGNEAFGSSESNYQTAEEVGTIEPNTDSIAERENFLTGSNPGVSNNPEVLSLGNTQTNNNFLAESSATVGRLNSQNTNYQHDLNFDDAEISEEGGYEQHGSYKIFEDGKEYSAYLESEYDKMELPWLSGGNAFEGSRALGVAANETLEYDKQRIMYHIDSIYFEQQTVSLEFAFKLGIETAPPEDFTIIHQFWQSGGGTTNPPLEMRVVPGENDDEMRLVVLGRNNQTKNYHNDPEGQEPYVLVDREIEKDEYYELKMEFVPSYNGDGIAGKFKMWMNDIVVSDYPKIDIGYDPSIRLDPNPGGKEPDDFLHNTIGIYRYGPEPHFQVYFDNIRMSSEQ